ncbi:MAG: metallophosphoesterase [Myxococcales bacterium]|nr:metallophosphoesterase [Myxococcales bacterium]
MWNTSHRGETVIAHITDAHVAPHGRCTAVLKHRSVEIFADLVDQLHEAAVQAVLFGGDNIDNRGHGEEDLEAFLQLTQPLGHRWVAQFGNHEAATRRPGRIDKYTFAKAIDGRGIGPHQHDFSTVFGDVRVVGIDTTLVGSPGGFVSPETMRFLARELASAEEQHVVVLGHHPLYPAWAPYALDSWDREYLVANRHVVCSLLASFPRVRAYLCGHHHASRIQRVWGRGQSGGFYHVQTASPAAFPHSARLLTFTDTELRIQALRPKIDGLLEEGAKWVQTGRKSGRYEQLGASPPFLDYLAGAEEDNNLVVQLTPAPDRKPEVLEELR